MIYEVYYATERPLVLGQIIAGVRDPNALTDRVFFARHPERNGMRLAPHETALRHEWMSILQRLVQPTLASVQPAPAPAPAPSAPQPTSGPVGTAGFGEVAAALRIAKKAVPGMPGTTIEMLVERWRSSICPEIPQSILIAFMRYESGGNFTDATHGAPRNGWTSPPFYELGLFQTPAGLHGRCTSGDPRSCEFAPPGREAPGDPSTWVKLCAMIKADSRQWTNPTTQVRVGLLDLELGAQSLRKSFPDLFARPGSDWDLRMAVLYRFARGGGYASSFLHSHRSQLAAMPEAQRWNYLRNKSATATVMSRGKRVTIRREFLGENVEKKMALAMQLGYRPSDSSADRETLQGESPLRLRRNMVRSVSTRLNPALRRAFPVVAPRLARQARGVQFAPFMQATGACPSPIAEVIRGWGQYKDAVKELPSSEQDKIARLADLVVTSFAAVGCSPLGKINIVGHADHDFHGAAFEQKVSEERATSVAAALATAIINEWKKRKLGPFRKGAIAFDKKGVGATIPDRSNVPVVKDRTQNRRVEIEILTRGAPVPPPDTFERRVARFLALTATKQVDPDPKGKRTVRIRCILSKLLRPDLLDLFVDGTASNQTIGRKVVNGNLCSFDGNYDPPPLSDADLAKFLGRVTLVLKGPGFAPDVPDDQILRGLSELVRMINEGIVRVEQYITKNSSDFGYTGDQTRGRRLSSIFADHLDDERSIYSCYKDFHGGE